MFDQNDLMNFDFGDEYDYSYEPSESDIEDADHNDFLLDHLLSEIEYDFGCCGSRDCVLCGKPFMQEEQLIQQFSIRRSETKVKHYFKQNVFEELIATVMHPDRIHKQNQQFDDLEDYFQSFGY